MPTRYVYEFEPEEDLEATSGKTSRARIHEASFRMAAARGVKIAFGTDVGPFPHGTQAKEFEIHGPIRHARHPSLALRYPRSGGADGLAGPRRLPREVPGSSWYHIGSRRWTPRLGGH